MVYIDAFLADWEVHKYITLCSLKYIHMYVYENLCNVNDFTGSKTLNGFFNCIAELLKLSYFLTAIIKKTMVFE